MTWVRHKVLEASISVPMEKIMGKQRPRMNTRTRRTYTPSDTKRAESAIRKAFTDKYGMTFSTWDGIVIAHIVSYRPLFKSNPKYWEGRADLGKPDWDNIGKLACDALNGIAYVDDSQIEKGITEKERRTPFGTEPRIDITFSYYTETYEKGYR